MQAEAVDIDYQIISGFLQGIKPDPIISVSQWAEDHRELPPGSAEPGKFRVDRTPYMREIMDHLSVTDQCQKVVFKKSSQVGATETGNNWLGYVIDVAPSPMLYIMPTDAMVKSTSKKRIQPMIETTPRLQQKIKPNKSRDSGNTIQEKFFQGGSVSMVGANSPVGLASAAIRYVYLDEVDRYPMDVQGEGSAITLAETRTISYGARKKIFITSTPTRKGQSAIDNEFDKTGQRHYFVPCPHCGGAQALKFEQLRYEPGKWDQTKYECEHCKELILERHKPQMFAAGKWMPLFPEKEDGITYGYFINALYSPYGWYSWGMMAKEYEESAGDIPKRITWINTKKGECYEHEGDSPQWEILYAQRRQDLVTKVPKANVAFITAGVDVQADRFEVEIVGWMKGKQSQSIDYRVIMGDTSNDANWEALAALLNETFVREDGVYMQINMMGVDSGYNTSYVYEFCSRHAATGRVIPIKGDDRMSMIFAAPKPVQLTRQGQKIGTVKVFKLGVSMIKSELYGWLKQLPKGNDYPPGYCFFPQYDEIFFRGLTAEKLESTTNNKGFTVMQWVKHYKRNEPLDCRVYARGVASIFGIDLLTDKHWESLVMNAGTKPAAQKEHKKPKGSSFWG
jgi:phage terminase large subunit GpA-like protein